jgi:hypothetical protein
MCLHESMLRFARDIFLSILHVFHYKYMNVKYNQKPTYGNVTRHLYINDFHVVNESTLFYIILMSFTYVR